MRLHGFHVNGFGMLTDVSADDLSAGLNVIVGDNGAGKSTLLEFFRAVLFGFRDRRQGSPRYEPIRGGSHGGSLVIELADGHRYRVTRSDGKRVTGDETVVSLTDGAPNRALDEMLGGASRDVFENVFAFSLAELQNVATLEHSELQARLYAAGSGTGARAAPAVRAALEEASKKLYSQRGKSELGRVLEQLQELRRRRAELSDAAERYARLQDERAELVERLTGIVGRENGAGAALAERKALVEARPDWEALNRQRSIVAELSGVSPLPERSEERLDAAKRDAEERGKLAEEALGRLRRAEAEIVGACARLGEGWTEQRVAQLDAGDATAATIGEFGRELEAASTEVTRAETAVRHAENAARQASEARAALEKEEQDHWPKPPRAVSSIETDLETVRSVRADASRLVEERGNRSELEGKRHAAEGEVRHLREAPEPIAPTARIPLMVAIGALAGASVVFRISLPAALGLLALFVAAAAVAIRGHRRARSLVRAQRADEIREAEGKLKDLDDDLAAADESIGKRQSALNEMGARFGVSVVRSASDLDPVEKRLNAERDAAAAFVAFGLRLKDARKAEALAADQLEEARKGLSQAVGAAGAVKTRWSGWLGEIGLDQNLNPQSASQRVQAVRGIQDLLRVRSQRSDEARSSAKRLTDVQEQIKQIIAEAGDANEEAFRDHAKRWHALESARAALDTIERRLEARAGSSERWAAMQKALEASEPDDLIASMNQALEDVDALRGEHDATTRRQGEVEAEMRGLETSEEQEIIAARMADLRAEAGRIVEQWAVRRLCMGLLDEARTKFERERQPEVIRRAGEHLQRITGGRYVRLVRRLDSGALDAETAEGIARDRSAWNRGLLEQIYLCLRLGFIEDYCRSTEPLPIIMDDVFANFDPDHARQAAAAVADFARERQVLYLTCHPETAGFFTDAGAASVYRLEDYRLARGE